MRACHAEDQGRGWNDVFTPHWTYRMVGSLSYHARGLRVKRENENNSWRAKQQDEKGPL
jgi:hypothetical protein